MLNFAMKATIISAVVWLLALPAGAETAAGQRLYLKYCSACHGSTGKGDGIVSGFMQPKPPNLTLLAKRNNGNFPTVAVINIIDGRSTLRAHGDADMPVWGAMLRSDASDANNPDLVVYSVVAQITDYLRSIQTK